MTINRLRRPLWAVPLAIAVFVAVFGWWGNARLRETIEDQLTTALTATLDANLTALDIWTANQSRLATALAEDPEIKEQTVRALDWLETQSADSSQRPPPDVAKLEHLLRPRLAELGYSIANLVGTNLMVVGSSTRGAWARPQPVDEQHVAKYNELFRSGNSVIITPFKPRRPPATGTRREREPGPRRATDRTPPPENDSRSEPRLSSTEPDAVRRTPTLMQVAVPVRDANGTVRGALALVIDPDFEFSRILSVARWGYSGETYAFDQNGLMISRSRFDEHLKALGLLEDRPETTSALTLRLSDPGMDNPARIAPEDSATAKRPLIQIIANAMAGGGGTDVKPSRDYRGVRVVGAWRWLPQLDIGVATQIDAAEAYRPLRMLQLLFLSLFLLLLLCAIGMFLISLLNAIWVKRLGEAELKLKKLGQYALEEKIGEGGMGVVYRARHALMRRDTAIKLLLPERADPEATERFEREVQLACQLTHPNTIQVYDYGHTPDGIFYYAMEFLQGLNLLELVGRFGPLPESRVVHILSHVCQSLTEAHSLGLVHRDIKPANVFLCNRGGTPDCVKVLDFGLVRDFRGNNAGPNGQNNETGIIGTPLFMPPESLLDPGRSDPRSDVYSVGALGYYLLTGQCAFPVGTVAELMEKQRTESPLPPSHRTTNPISAEFEQIILRCLEKEPERRPQSAEDLRQLLLSTPQASAWTLPERIAWWEWYRTQPAPYRAPIRSGPGDPAGETVKIDVTDKL